MRAKGKVVEKQLTITQRVEVKSFSKHVISEMWFFKALKYHPH